MVERRRIRTDCFQGVDVPMQSGFDGLGTVLDQAINTYSLLGLLT